MVWVFRERAHRPLLAPKAGPTRHIAGFAAAFMAEGTMHLARRPRWDHAADYAELHCVSNFSFQRGASHPHELVERAAAWATAPWR